MTKEQIIAKMQYCQIILALNGETDESLFEAIEICTEAFKEKAVRNTDKMGFFQKMQKILS